MGEMYRTAKHLQEENETRRVLREAAIARQEEDKESRFIMREQMRTASLEKKQKYAAYKENVRKALVTEALKRIYVGSIKNPTSEEVAQCEAFLGNYINERGCDTLIDNFRISSTTFLETMSELVNKYTTIMTEDSDIEDPETFVVDKEHINDFMDELQDKEDVEDITQTIRMRVASAEEDFVNRNIQDRHNIKTILDDTAKRVQDAKPELDNEYGPSEDEADDIQQEHVLISKQRIKEVNARPRSVFDRMVHSVSESVLKNPQLREQYMGEAGRLDMDKIVGSVRCMYTMLEMVSTLRIDNVDAKYIEDTINSI